MDKAKKHKLKAELDQLNDMSLADLKMLWPIYVSTLMPAGARRGQLADELAYRIQVELYGDVPKLIRRQLARLAESKTQKVRHKTQLSEGVRLVRKWQGREHVVTSVTGGFEYDGTIYKSLSKVAEVITGSKWSGPVFFGIKAGRK